MEKKSGASRGAEKGAAASSNNRGRRRVGGRENIE